MYHPCSSPTSSLGKTYRTLRQGQQQQICNQLPPMAAQNHHFLLKDIFLLSLNCWHARLPQQLLPGEWGFKDCFYYFLPITQLKTKQLSFLILQSLRLKQLLCFCDDVNMFHFYMLIIIYMAKPLIVLIFSYFVKANCTHNVPSLKFLVQHFNDMFIILWVSQLAANHTNDMENQGILVYFSAQF